MITESAAKKDTQKLQRAIVDGLEDVKAQNIHVFNTEHLSALFERVIVASGTSNRQTKALAASVRDAVREAGFPKPRIEGEENGEWIIVDCGAAVAHIMQPAIREYYNLEEIWGEKPIRLKFGASRPAQAEEPVAKPAAKTGKKPAVDGPSLRRSSAAKTAIKAAEQAAKAPTKRAPAKSAGKTAGKTTGKPAGRGFGKAPARSSAAAPATSAAKPTKLVVGKPPAKKVAAKSPAAAPARKPAPRKA